MEPCGRFYAVVSVPKTDMYSSPTQLVTSRKQFLLETNVERVVDYTRLGRMWLSVLGDPSGRCVCHLEGNCES